jgi:outer membrane protein
VKYWIPLAACSCIASGASALAQTTSAAPDSDPWVVTLGGNAVAAPAYPGARSFGFLAYPSLSFRRASSEQSFSAPDDNISFTLYNTGTFRAGPSGKLVGSRRAADHRELAGLRDVDWAIEAGGFVEFWPMQKLRTRLELRHGLRGHEGVVGDLGADYVETFNAWTASIGPRASFGSSTYARAYFSVSPAEAAASGRVAPYGASDGITSVGATAALSYTFSPELRATGYVRHDHLTGAAGKSPIVRVLGMNEQSTYGLKLFYSFSTNGF